MSKLRVAAALAAAWDAGVRYFDTAPLYGAGEGERRMDATFDEATGSLLVVVSDGSRAVPRPQGDLPPDVVGGRGLMIVERLATAWGSDPSPTGKSVWFRLERG